MDIDTLFDFEVRFNLYLFSINQLCDNFISNLVSEWLYQIKCKNFSHSYQNAEGHSKNP